MFAACIRSRIMFDADQCVQAFVRIFPLVNASFSGCEPVSREELLLERGWLASEIESGSCPYCSSCSKSLAEFVRSGKFFRFLLALSRFVRNSPLFVGSCHRRALSSFFEGPALLSRDRARFVKRYSLCGPGQSSVVHPFYLS